VAAPLAVAVGETVPHGVGEHDKVQVTPLLIGSPATVAVSWTVPAACTVPVLWVIVTAVARTVTIAVALAEALATEMAVMVTIKSLAGGVVGAA
jgi:hypothetical protein